MEPILEVLITAALLAGFVCLIYILLTVFLASIEAMKSGEDHE